MNKAALITLAVVLAMVFAGCVAYQPKVQPGVTIPPKFTPAPPTPPPTPEPTVTPVATPAPTVTPEPTKSLSPYDELGEYITGTEHYKRYITFENIQVYEQAEDTFVDMVAVNAYPSPLVCAISINFEDAEGTDEIVADCRLQTQDGQYVLILQPGRNSLYATVQTDMRITNCTYSILYDEKLGVMPDVVE